MRKLVCDIQDNGAVDVKFIGAHLNKRELLRLLKAIRLEYRKRIRMYRSELMAKHSGQRQEAEVEAIRLEDVGKEIDEKLAAETSKADAKNVGVKEDDVRITKTKEREDGRRESSGGRESTVERSARATRAYTAAVGSSEQDEAGRS